MKTIIAGSRNITDREALTRAISECPWSDQISEVICGCAGGADAMGKTWAKERGVPVSEFPADWDSHGRSAGPIRNRQMAEYGDALIALWDGRSGGTANMIAHTAAGMAGHGICTVGWEQDNR